MEVLLLKCLIGKKIGEIDLKHINKYGFFYYVVENNKVNCTEIINDDKCIPIIIIQYNKKNTPIGIGCGKVYKYDKLNENKSYLKISNIKSFCLNNHLEGDLKKKQEDSFNSLQEKVKEYINKDNYILSSKNYEIAMLNLSDTMYKQIFNEIKSCGNKNYAIEEGKDIQEVIDSYINLEGDLSIDDRKLRRLRPAAQRSIYAKRVINKGDIRKNRTEYQRDWERIIHSKSFRRLEDKAQIYTLSKGDHFRTRLTHTLEVTQIARGIARELKLNEDLVEAIALGHDLGHTPFGHVGERTLNEILEKENVEGGFKHNFQGVKVVNYLEEKYGEFEGIDLTYQVMEGILKHTKVCGCKDKKSCTDKTKGLNCNENIYNIDNFLCNGDKDMLHPEYDFATTLEGQVVAVADEIAQRAHDLDDGIASGIINESDFLNQLRSEKLFDELNERIQNSVKYIKKDERDYIDEKDIMRARIVSDVITYFILNIVKDSEDEIEKYEKEMRLPLYNDINHLSDLSKVEPLVIKKKLICFKGKTEQVRKELEKISSSKIINSEEVNCFDGKGKYIINKLYKAYKTNPMQMSKTTLKRIYREISKYMNDTIDLTNCDSDLAEEEINVYIGSNDLNDLDLCKHKIFVRCVVDLISGMTDDYANRQFAKLYSPRVY